LRLQPRGAPFPQHLERGIAIDQFTALGLSEAFLDVRGYRIAMFQHPVFKIQLLADNLERLIEHLARVTVGASSDRQVEHALLFRFQVNRHGRISFP